MTSRVHDQYNPVPTDAAFKLSSVSSVLTQAIISSLRQFFNHSLFILACSTNSIPYLSKNGSNFFYKFIKKYTKKPKYYKEILTSYRLCLFFIQPEAKAMGCPACPIMMLKILTSNGTCPLFVKK